MRPALTRRWANAMAGCALRALPAARAPWARAMQSEMAYLSDRAALRWALGCCVAAATLRINSMMTGDLKISRFILVPEMLLCFAPLCLLWCDAARAISSIAQANSPFFLQTLLDTTGGRVVLLQLITGVVVGLLGPLGLIASLWPILSRRPLKYRYLGAACVTGSVILGLVYFASAFFMEPGAWQNPDYWRFGVLLALPVLAAVHLMRIGLWPTRHRAEPTERPG